MTHKEANMSSRSLKKVAEVTAAFWIMKICATTLGETVGDLLSMTLKIGYGASTVILLSFFLLTLIGQLLAKKYYPILYWLVILSTSTAGTTLSDYLDRTVGLGYATGSLILVSLLIVVLAIWRMSVGSLSVERIDTFKPELFYWIAILISNTLGTALGDFLADSSGLGFSGGAALIGGLLTVIVIVYYRTNISRVFLFWVAFILTRPFGATFGDLLTKTPEQGGLGLGTIGSSLVLASILAILIVRVTVTEPQSAAIVKDPV
jgi:uncharacterized membrane-anchored protein